MMKYSTCEWVFYQFLVTFNSFYDYQECILLLLPCDWLRDQTQGSLSVLNALHSFVLLLCVNEGAS